ncbi:MAG: sigma-70 family RNA polymerase sigma factor [Tannerella sp.]|jgi:RNA polymerase sigma factor (sigma-70 family)|nr:sigma-70 family RNA polymerase sigma factor [Tannerella sp.]
MSTRNVYTIDESLLWEKILAGDEDAYSYLYRQYVEELFSYGMRFTSDKELIKDCIQDLFVKIYSNRSNLSCTDNVKLYLFIALKNILFNVFEKDKSLYKMDTIEPVFTVEYTIEDEWIENELEQERRNKINKVLETLTPRQKEVIYYRYTKGLKLNHIGEIMDMNYQSVQNLLQRSIKKLRSALAEKEKQKAFIKKMRSESQ